MTTKLSMMNRGNRALFLHRESSGRNDQAPAQYLEWGLRRTRELKLTMDASVERINSMILSGSSVDGDIYLDFDVSGDQLDRPALSALLRRIANDFEVSAVFIPRRDRLARPDNPEDGVRIETMIRRAGISLHYQDRTLGPLGVRERASIGDFILAAIEFDQAAQFRRELASKMLHAQRNLTSQGFSTGGRAPFFLRRWLIGPNGEKIRELSDGEVVRLKGCHVAWLPTDERSLQVALLIVDLLEKMPATCVVKELMRMGIPSPDAHRTRRDHGVVHLVSGVWNSTTIVNVVRGLKLLGLVVYGRRSMGDQLRYSPTGPRELTADDLRQDKKPKIVLNPESEWSKESAHYATLIAPERLQLLLEELDRRAGTQRGKPRSRDRENNPLGSRVFDMACGWPMYREPTLLRGQKTFRYKCGAYTQSHGVMCSHNHVNGPQAARFALEVIQQQLNSPTLSAKIQNRLQAFAAAENAGGDESAMKLKNRRGELVRAEQDLEIARRNLARARSDEEYAAVAGEFEKLQQRKKQIEQDLAAVDGSSTASEGSRSDEIASALAVFGHLKELLGGDLGTYRLLGELFEVTNLRMFLQFSPVQEGKRKLQGLVSGVVTIGDVKPPIEIYQGKTGRHALKELCGDLTKTPRPHQCGGGENVASDGDGSSLGNQSRRDRTSIELFSGSFGEWRKWLIKIVEASAN